jgi:hypothetical protein
MRVLEHRRSQSGRNCAARFCVNSMRGNDAGIIVTEFYGDNLDGYLLQIRFLNFVIESWSARLFRRPKHSGMTSSKNSELNDCSWSLVFS